MNSLMFLENKYKFRSEVAISQGGFNQKNINATHIYIKIKVEGMKKNLNLNLQDRSVKII